MTKHSLEHHNEVLAAIVNISQQLFVAGDFEEKLAYSLAQLTEALNITHAYIFQNDETQNGRTLSHRYEWSHQRKEILIAAPDLQHVSYANMGFSRWEKLLTKGEVVYGRLPDFPPSEQEIFQKRGILSILAAPIQQGHHWWGVIVLDDHQTPRHWIKTEVEAIRSLGNILGAAFATQRLYDSEKKAREKAEVLREFARIVNTSLVLEDVLRQSMEQLRRVMIFDTASIYLFPRKSNLGYFTGVGFNNVDETAARAVQYLKDSPILQRMAQNLQPLLAADVRQLADWIWVPGTEHIRSFLLAPLTIQEKMIGALMLDSWQIDFFTEEDLLMAQALAQHIATAIENAWLYEEREQQLHLATVLQQVGVLLTTDAKPEVLYEQLFDLLAEVVTYDSVTLQLLTPDKKYLVLAAERGFADIARIREIVRSLSVNTLSKLPSPPYWDVIPDTYQDDRWQVLPGSEQIRSWIGAALLVKGRLIGILNVDSHTVNAYDERMAATVAVFANQAAVAIERAQLYEQLQAQTTRLAQEVQVRTAELQMERDRTLSILESVGESIIVTDLNATILYVNPAMEKQSGYKREEVLGQNPRILRSPFTPVAAYEKMWTTILSGDIWSGEIVNQRKDGTYYDLAVTIAPIKAPGGEITSFVSVQSDISRFKELDRLKSKFVSNVSHELRTPLTNIKLYLTLLARGKPERQEQYLEVLHHEVERLTTLIQDLLDLSRLESELLPNNRAQVDPRKVLLELLESFQLKAELKGIALKTAVSESLPEVQVAGNHLGQLLTNLIENALAYTPNGGEVRVQMETAVSHNRTVVKCIIADNGPGISAEDLPYLFHRFYRGEMAKEGSVPGTGLGLAICKEVIDRYNGQIRVESAPGQGATFTIELPLADG